MNSSIWTLVSGIVLLSENENENEIPAWARFDHPLHLALVGYYRPELALRHLAFLSGCPL